MLVFDSPASSTQFSPPPKMSSLDVEDLPSSGTDAEAASLQLVLRLQMEEEAWHAEQMAMQERAPEHPEDEDSLALAIRLQQEDDDALLRSVLGMQARRHAMLSRVVKAAPGPAPGCMQRRRSDRGSCAAPLFVPGRRSRR